MAPGHSTAYAQHGRRLCAVVAGLLCACFVSTNAMAAKPAANCVPGAQVTCACPHGDAGVQVCDDDGRRFEPCQCAAPDKAPTGTPGEARPGGKLIGGGIALLAAGFVSSSIGASILMLVAVGVADDDLVKDGAAALPVFLILQGVAATAVGVLCSAPRRIGATAPRAAARTLLHI